MAESELGCSGGLNLLMCVQSGEEHIYRVDIYLGKECGKMCFLRHLTNCCKDTLCSFI